MKNFLLFAFFERCAQGGMDDFMGDFDSLEEAIDFFKSTELDEGHVWCCTKQEIVYEY
jgi:hypothetical protein